MTHSALRRAVGALIVVVAAASLLGHGVVGSTFALFNGETTNSGTQLAAGWIPPPTNLKSTDSGYTITPTWTPGAATGSLPTVTTQKVYYYDNGASTSCPAVNDSSYTLLSTFNNHTTSTYTDTNRASGHNGDIYCYEVTSASSTYASWTSGATYQTWGGMALTGVSIGNDSGSIAANDTIVLTWSQRTNLTATSATVCAYSNGTILIGDNHTTCNSSTGDTYSIAKLTGATGISSTTAYTNSTVSTPSPYLTTTITLKNGSSRTVSGASTWTATPSTSIRSNTGTITVCTSGSNCLPTTTSSF